MRSFLSLLRVRFGIIIILAFLPVAGLTLHTDLEEREIIISMVEGDVQQAAQFISGTQEQLLEGTRQLLSALSEHPEVRSKKAAGCGRLFQKVVSGSLRYSKIGLAGTNGELICASESIEKAVNLRTYGWFKQTIEEAVFAAGAGQTGIGSPVTLNFCYPVQARDGTVKSVLFASMELEQLNQIVADVLLQEKSEFLMVAQSGAILAYLPNPEMWIGTYQPDAPIIQAILSRGSDVAELPGLDGVTRLYAFNRIRGSEENGIYVCFGVPITTAYREANETLFRHLTMLGAITILALLAVWYGGGAYVLKRVNAVLDAANRLSSGEMGARTGIKEGPGELDRLAVSFDQMAGTLEEREIEIRKAETRYRTLVEQLPAVTYASDMDHARTLRYMSPQIAGVTGFPPERWLAEPDLWSDAIHPEDLERVKKAIDRSRTERIPFGVEYRLISASGKTVWVHDEAVVLSGEAGETPYLQGVIRDISDQRAARAALQESEERFRLMVESVRDYAIVMLDPTGEVVSWNLGAQRLLGYSSEQIIGRSFSTFYSDEDLENEAPGRELNIAGSEGRFEGEGWRMKMDGSRFWAGVILTPMTRIGQYLIGYSLITRDLSEQKDAQERLMEYQEQLRSLASELSLAEERERRRIATELHDSVGQTLAMCKIRLGILGQSVPPEISPALAQVRTMIEQAITDTRSLIFKISSPILYELGFEAAMEWLTEQFQKDHGIDTSFVDDGTDKEIEEDVRVLLFQAAGELLANVAKHSAATRVDVTVATRASRLEMVVKDDGRGFDVSDIEIRSGKRFGFGLFSIRERFRHIGGTVGIVSSPGNGTSVTVELPIGGSGSEAL